MNCQCSIGAKAPFLFFKILEIAPYIYFKFSSTLENDVYKMLKEYSAKSDIPITKILDKAVVAYIRSQDKPPKP